MTYKSHPDLWDVEDADTVLWRYMDLYRFLDLLQESELHLTRVDQMEDKWEGSFSDLNVAERPAIYAEHWSESFAKAMHNLYLHGRTHTYLNCWYMGDAESYAMWKLYDAAGKGVAVKATIGRLQASLKGVHRPEVCGSQVKYVNYATTYIPERNLFLPYIHKRLSFAHEQEYRLLAMWSPKVLETDQNNTATLTEPDVPPVLLREAVDLDELIGSVYVSPDAPDWVAKVVSEVTRQYLPRLEVRHSDLAADPVF
ncbi:DUF2971 domain-containing protein [Tessaracoccus sp. SD287]|uniref:DUF2971 domain-containing protein n=1 Tax=Tessaracoccus sp. SD287 TaxID=2782008 RepID=UPI001A960D3C|nr:DUF2971 domain-containing protein [Tessaracoccus sp. SD287]MBO1030961.1 DUF2971 domain-containing protein [Tessaracoccus sp. SD287]